MYFRNIILLAFLSLSFFVRGQNSYREKPFGLRYDLNQLQPEKLAFSLTPDITQRISSEGKDPLFAGVSIPADIDFQGKAEGLILHKDTTVFRLKIFVPGATRLGLVFNDLLLHESAVIHIYDENKNHFQRILASDITNDKGIYSTSVIPASTLIVEYFCPEVTHTPVPSFSISEIIYLIPGEFDLFASPGEKASGACNVNMNCPEGLAWQKQKRGIGRILLREGSSWFWCTGTLVNNTLEDGTPYFLTADHCGENSSEDDLLLWEFVFNYEYLACENQPSLPSENRIIKGSTLLAKGPLTGGSDFKLLLLKQTPPLSWNVYYNGWSRSTVNPSFGVSIHHPLGEPKKISTYTSTVFNTTYPDGMVSGFWRVVWAATESGHGVTEGGSSGAPMFDHNGLVVGTLTGGSASCAFPTSPDVFGKFNRHWAANGEGDTIRIQPWLDSQNDNPMSLYGYDPNRATNFLTINSTPESAGSVTGGGYYAEGEIIQLTATPNTGYVFVNWTDENTTQISLNSTHNFLMPGQEKVLTANFRESQTDTQELVIGKNFFIYPNPARDQLFIKAEMPLKEFGYIIYNSGGQKILAGELPSEYEDNNWVIDLSGIQGGLYLVHMFFGDKILSHKTLIIN